MRHGENQEDFIGGVPHEQNYALLPNCRRFGEKDREFYYRDRKFPEDMQ